MKRAAIHTLGCKVNAYESACIERELVRRGYQIVGFDEEADVYIVNTCTVTSIADHKSRQMLRQARTRNPEATVVAVGCYGEAAGDALVERGICDRVYGNGFKKGLSLTGKAADEATEACKQIGPRTYVKIEDGCDAYCAYCEIPYVRGRVANRPIDSVIEEVNTLVSLGTKEIVLTGINLSAYTELAGLLARLDGIEGLYRIRLGSLETAQSAGEMVEAFASCKKLCHHFHLSLQSGCDETLRRMNRHYTASMYASVVSDIRSRMPDAAITTDIMVGFPGETDEEFSESYAFARLMNFYEMHVFKYSERAGTAAAVMRGQVPEEVKTCRSQALLALSVEQSLAYRQAHLGSTLELLVERSVDSGSGRISIGHTREYIEAVIPYEVPPGSIITGRAVELRADGRILLGK